jgi:hypothetical protein
MILPHRLPAYSLHTFLEGHGRPGVAYVPVNRWMNESCCMPRQNCDDRDSWVSIKDPKVAVVNYYGLYVPLGNTNFLSETIRRCALTKYVGEFCP